MQKLLLASFSLSLVLLNGTNSFADTLYCSASSAPNSIQGSGEVELNTDGQGTVEIKLKNGYRLAAVFSSFKGRDRSCRNAHLTIGMFDKNNRRVNETSSSFPCGMMMPDVAEDNATRASLSTDVPLSPDQSLSILCQVNVGLKQKPANEAKNPCVSKVQQVALALANLSSGGGIPPYRPNGIPKEQSPAGPRVVGDKSYAAAVWSADGYDCNYVINAHPTSDGKGCVIGNAEFRMCAK